MNSSREPSASNLQVSRFSFFTKYAESKRSFMHGVGAICTRVALVGARRTYRKEVILKVILFRPGALCPANFWGAVSLLLIAFAVIDFSRPVSAQVHSTVGIYDEPTQTNSVDFVAAGSTLNFVDFKVEVARAFTNGFGGVNQCESIGVDVGPYTFSYGLSQTKRLNMTGATNNSIGLAESSSSKQPISESTIWASDPEMTFLLDDISSSVANEAVIKFGLTIVSTTFFSLDDVTATASF